jgi:hypothetical protein
MLLLASATETNAPREIAAANPPALGRSTTPKDLYEGYGIVNPDAAVEAAALAYDSLTSFTASTLPETPSERRAWGRHITVPAGTTLTLSLAVPSTADYDLYLYSATPGPNGNPAILLAADHAPLGESEPLTWTPTVATSAYLIIKRVSGHGAFTLTGCVCDADAGATCFGSAPPCIPPPPPLVEAGPPPLVDGSPDPNAGIDSGVGPGGEAPADEGCDCKSAPSTSSSPRSSMVVLATALALASILRRGNNKRNRPPN